MADFSFGSGRFGGGFASALLALALIAVQPAAFSQASAPSPEKTHRKVVVRVEPDYPYVLRNGHFVGQVRLEVTVLPNGSVSRVEPKGGNPMLSQYAAAAVMRWKYAPGPSQTVEEAIFIFDPK